MHLDVTEDYIKTLTKKDKRIGWVIDNYTILAVAPYDKGRNRKYAVKCSVCAQDPYLFGLGIFSTEYFNIQNHIPCGCSGNFLYTEALEYKRMKRVIENFGFSFLGFDGEFKGNKTKCKVVCPEHGESANATVNYILSENRPTCPGCSPHRKSRSRAAPDEEKIAQFMITGVFHPDTIFYRSERKTSEGWRHWFMVCGECGTVGETADKQLVKGTRSCECPKARQKQAYINLVYNDQDAPVALKFGIANSAGNRIDSQNSVNTLKCRQLDVFQFETKMSCLAAEREVKSSVERKFLSKEVFPDGWTETTDVKFMIDIIKIYKKHGGVSIMHVDNQTYREGCIACVESKLFNINHAEGESSYFRTKFIELENYD